MGILGKKIFSFHPGVFGLDIDDLCVKAAKIDDMGKWDRVHSLGSVMLAPGAVTDGEIVDVEAVVSAIRELMRQCQPKPLKTRYVYCALPENKSFIRVVEMPMMKEEELREAMKWQVEENIPLGLDQVYYNWKMLPSSLNNEKNSRSVILAAVSKHVADSFLRVIRQADLDSVGMEVQSFAQNYALVSDDSTQTVVIVDISDRRTSIVFSVAGCVCFTSSIPVSNQMFIESIARGLGVSNEDAKGIKKREGIGSMVKHDPLFFSIEPVLENLFSQTQAMISFFTDNLSYSKTIDMILLCGEGGKTKNLSPYLSKKLGKVTKVGDPWTNVRLDKSIPPISREDSISFSTVIGLALRSQKKLYENIT